jgi:DNA-binding PadR family transcriptional regulator
MDVRTLCLGLLSYGEACGYELKRRFESDFRHFFTAGFGSIYPALAELADAGLVSCRSIHQDGKPERKVYRITEAGRREFLQALGTTTPQHKLRSEFLAMIYFAELMDPERLDSLLDDRLRQLREAAAQISALQRERGADMPSGASFVAGFGAMLARVAADYIETNRHLLTRGRPRVKRGARAGAIPEQSNVESLT